MTIHRKHCVKRAAFSLMELMVVVAIILVLVGVGGYYFFGSLDKAKESTARTKAIKLGEAAMQFKTNNGDVPESLEVLLIADPNNADKPYVANQQDLLDPWGKPYQYNPMGERNNGLFPDVWTTNPGQTREIGNWAVGN